HILPVEFVMSDTIVLERAAGRAGALGALRARKLPFSRRSLLSVGAAIAVALGGAAYIAAPKASVSTDAAYVEADTSVVAPKVSGLVEQVLVAHNQTVRRGQPLLV